MAKARERTNGRTNGKTATIGHEPQVWQMADALNGSMEMAEHKNSVLGLIFQADFANPPLNVSDGGRECLRDDKRWHCGVPPVCNTRLVWVQWS